MLASLEAQVKRSFGCAETAAETAFRYLAQYGLRILGVTFLAIALIVLVWAHWAV